MRQTAERFRGSEAWIGIDIDPVTLLVTDQNLAVAQRQPFGIHLHLARRFAAAHIQHGGDTDFSKARQRPDSVTRDSARQPMAGIQHRNEILPVWAEADGGYGPEQFFRRAHYHAADKFQLAETFLAGADFERRQKTRTHRHIDGRSADGNREQRCGRQNGGH
ncbi:hypothetical protein D3C72_894910 [compost metagenome]